MKKILLIKAKARCRLRCLQKPLKASYPGYYQEAVVSGSGSFRSVGCGPSPATVGFHLKAVSAIGASIIIGKMDWCQGINCYLAS